MDFNFFLQEISKIKNLPLPGEASHGKMIPEIRAAKMLELLAHREKARKAGVMALFYPDKNNVAKVLLILRKTYKGVHSNQIGFPGGKEEIEDIDLQQTALRETEEEVGVLPETIQTIKALSKVYVPASNFEVYPFIGCCNATPSFVMQEEEVADLVEVFVTDLMNEASVIQQIINTSYAENVSVPAYKLNGYTVWGATAMMLSEIKELLKQVL